MAAIDLERLVVQFSADTKRFENSMRKLQSTTNQQLGRIERRAQQSAGSIAASFARTGLAIGAAFAGSAAIREIGRLSDAATRIDNALKVAGLSGQDLEDTYKALAAAAKENSAPIQSLVDLYSKVSLVQKELNVSNQDLIKFSGNVALALRVAGTDATAASGALLQLSQALGGGTVRAEEFNSILEGAPTIARAAAFGLKEAGGSVSELRKLVIDGALSSEAFFRAFEAGSVVLQEQAKSSVLTLGQAMTNLQNALVDAAREFNNATGAGESFAKGIDNIASAVDSVDFEGLINKIREAKAEFDAFLAGIDFTALGKALGVITEEGLAVNIDKREAEDKVTALEREVELLQATIEKNTALGFDNTEALARIGEVIGALNTARAAAAAMSDTAAFPTIVPGEGLVQGAVVGGASGVSMGGPTGRGGRRRQAAVTPVSIADFAVPTGGKSGGGGKKGGGKSRESEYQREIEQIKERTAAIQAETAAQATVNPLIEDYGFASERASVAQDLLTAAQKSGLAVGKELKDVSQLLSGNFEGLSPAAREQAAAMLELANGYATASVEAEKLKEKQDKIKQAADDFKSLGKSVVSGFISDLRAGKSAAEALEGALDKVIDKMIDMALNTAFDSLNFGSLFGGGGGAFNPVGKVGLFSEGGYTGNGGKLEPAGVVHKGEYVMDAESTKRIGVDNLRKLQGYANGGLVGAPSLPNLGGMRGANDNKMTVVVRVDNDGNLQAFVQKESAQVSAQVVQATAPAIVNQSVQASGSALSKGKYDFGMSKYGQKRQANVG